MLSEEIAKLERENSYLKALLEEIETNPAKMKNCTDCKFYRQHYCKQDGVYYKIYAGHCICGIPAKKRKGKKEPFPDDTCLYFEEKSHVMEI